MKRFYSRKTNMILNTIDFVFWGAVIGITAYFRARKGCVAIGCSLTYAIIALACVLL
jgi:hypothetical protein